MPHNIENYVPQGTTLIELGNILDKLTLSETIDQVQADDIASFHLPRVYPFLTDKKAFEIIWAYAFENGRTHSYLKIMEYFHDGVELFQLLSKEGGTPLSPASQEDIQFAQSHLSQSESLMISSLSNFFDNMIMNGPLADKFLTTVPSISSTGETLDMLRSVYGLSKHDADRIFIVKAKELYPTLNTEEHFNAIWNMANRDSGSHGYTELSHCFRNLMHIAQLAWNNSL